MKNKTYCETLSQPVRLNGKQHVNDGCYNGEYQRICEMSV